MKCLKCGALATVDSRETELPFCNSHGPGNTDIELTEIDEDWMLEDLDNAFMLDHDNPANLEEIEE